MGNQSARRRAPGVSTVGALATGTVLFLQVVPTMAEPRCVGDVDGNGTVTISELIQGVSAAFGRSSAEVAPSFDRDGSGQIEIGELVTAVGNALRGCPPVPTEVDTPTPTAVPPAGTPTSVPTRPIRGSFERSTAFDAVVSEIDFPYGSSGVTSAMAVDLDANGLLDVLVAVGRNGAHRATWATYQSAPNVWEPLQEIEGLGGPRALTDLNGDGYLDLLLGSRLGVAWGAAGGIDLESVQPFVGADPTPQSGSYDSAITPMDLDGDGLTDLAVAAFGGRDRILYQKNDGTFEEYWLDFGLSFALCPVDFNDDGLIDLISMVDGFFREDANEGGSWQQVEARTWVHEPPQGWPADRYLAPGPLDKGTPMGCAWGELDGDRDLELWLSQISTATPIYDRRDGSWRDVGRTLEGISGFPRNEVQEWQVFWGVAIVDFDGDGRDDIAVAGGLEAGYEGPRQSSYVGLFFQGVSGFEELGRHVGLDETGDFQSLLADDVDGDGFPDLLVGQFGALPRLYLNRLEPRGGIVSVQLEGRAVENVEVEFLGRGKSWTMWPGRLAQPLTGARPILFRGVGDERAIQLRVHWPAGVTELQVQPRAEPWIIAENVSFAPERNENERE